MQENQDTLGYDYFVKAPGFKIGVEVVAGSSAEN